MRLHRLAQVVRDLGDLLAARRPRRGARGARGDASPASAGSGLCAWRCEVLVDDEVAGGAAEHEQVEQRIGAEAVGAVHRHAGAFADRVEARRRPRSDRRPSARRPGRGCWSGCRPSGSGSSARPGSARVIGSTLANLMRDLADRRQPLHDHLRPEVIELEQHVVLVRAAAAPFLDLLVHRARDDVARREVLQVRRVALHEALAVAS